ncbi:MAG TPA: M23 family peptidase [Rhodospirillales bacterium]|nr:M23 family peptidase [Rhodospirillales bacterium]
MLLRGTLAATILIAGVLLSARFVLEPTDKDTAETTAIEQSTLALAPLSLGNPAAAAALRIKRPNFPASDPDLTGDIPRFTKVVTAGKGDTLSRMLIRAGISGRETDAVIAALAQHFNPGRLRLGQTVSVNFQADGQSLASSGSTDAGRFMGVSLIPDRQNRIVVARGETGNFEAALEKRQLTAKLVRATNTITYSLSRSGNGVRVPNGVLGEMIRLYSWDVDFQRDIRKGDAFEILYERFFDDQGKASHNGNIVFASLTLSGKRYAVYRHTLKNGETDYFDEQGQSARKALMRTPIDGARLSSGFGKRKHPVLGFTKMHTGVDFAAPRGTPIYAAGNGTVEYAGRNGGYGNYVRIRHNSEYSTAYAHMKRVNTAKGRRVKQGQVIGFVGSSGRSTGPHLHYEILRGNRQVNPLRVKMPSGRKLKGTELALFHAARIEIEAQYAEAGSILELASGD